MYSIPLIKMNPSMAFRHKKSHNVLIKTVRKAQSMFPAITLFHLKTDYYCITRNNIVELSTRYMLL